jgi:cysteinyl-tRNA synthetase
MNYSTDALKDAVSLEKYIFNFYASVKHAKRTVKSEGRKWSQQEIQLNQTLLESQKNVDHALRDNIDTKTALDSIKDLINSWNIYEKAVGSSSVHVELTEDISKFVSHILTVFGLESESESSPGNSVDFESTLLPILEVLANFRLEMRSQAIKSKNTEILTACDRLRDDILPQHGIVFEDKDDNTVVKIVDKATILKEQESKRRAEELKQQEKEKRRKEAEEKELRNRLPPRDWAILEFLHSDYSQFDDKGIPTHGKDGQELSKGQRKKLLKSYEMQERKYQEWVKRNTNDPH